MANIIYNTQAVIPFLMSEYDINGLDLKVALLSNLFVPNQLTQQTYSDIKQFEIIGTGYVAGGKSLTNKRVSEYALYADALTWPTSSLSAAYGMVYINGGQYMPDVNILLFDLSGIKITVNGPFLVRWSRSGVIKIAQPNDPMPGVSPGRHWNIIPLEDKEKAIHITNADGTKSIMGVDTATGRLRVYTTGYEQLVLNDNDIPNKAYVENRITKVGVTETTINNVNPTLINVGGIPAGTVFNQTTFQQLVDEMFYPYQQPAFTTFNAGIGTVNEVGYVVPMKLSFAYAMSHQENVEPNTINIQDMTTQTMIMSAGIDIHDSTAFTTQTVGNHMFQITALNTQNILFTTILTFSFYFKIFHGELNTQNPTANDIAGLRVNSITPQYSGTYNFNAGGYKVIAYPATYGNLSSFKDTSTQLSVPMTPMQIVAITNQYGIKQDYKVYITSNAMNAAITIVAG